MNKSKFALGVFFLAWLAVMLALALSALAGM
jgi:hypothetical protein